MKALVDVGFQRPALHTVVAAPPLGADDRVVIFTRRYDGVDLDNDARSTLRPNMGWQTRWLRELAEPEPVRRAEVWTVERAAKKAGLEAGLASGTVKGRLVYRPQYELLSLVSPPKNATDVELVVKGWRLVIELVDNDAKVDRDLDAYTGEQIGEYSQVDHVTASLPTIKYGTQSIDISSNVFTRSSLYKDPVRASLLDATSGSPVNGQGIVTGTPTASSKPLSYTRISTTASYNNDIAFALEQSWDYFATTYGRRGLRNLQPSAKATANDAIVYFKTTGGPNVGMFSETGLIEVDDAVGSTWQGLWQNYVTVDVIAHEWTHAVYYADTAHVTSTTRWGANGGINEANSDLFGELIEARARHVAGLQGDDEIRDNWTIGQDSNDYWPSAKRYMCKPSTSPYSPNWGPYDDEWGPELDNPANNIEPHIAMGPIDRVWCLLGSGMQPWNPQTGDKTFQSPYVLTGFQGLGGPGVGLLEYRALGYMRGAPLPARFIDLRYALLDAATDYYGAYSDQYKAIEDAFATILVGAPADRTPPVITLTSGTLLNQNTPITVAVGSANPITSVSFVLDSNNLGTVYAAPWQLTPPATPEGNHTLYVTAVDAHRNKTTTQWAVVFDGSGPNTLTLTDVTPCGNGWCGDWQYKRVYHVAAQDFSGVASETLYLDGPPIAGASGGANDFTVTYSVGGQHTLRAAAVDALGNGSATGWQTVDIDLTPPTYASGPTFTPDANYEGRFHYNFCVNYDPSGWNTYLELDGVRTAFQQISVSGSCTTLQVSAVPAGTHTWKLHLFDRWNNDNVKSGSITLKKIPPTVGIPTVAIDTVTIGHVVVGTTYGATHGIASVALQICDGNGCGASTVFTPSNSSTDQSKHSFDVTGLLPGHSYAAQVSVTGYNGLTTTQRSMGFTIPGGQTNTDVVFNEVEPNNDWQYTSNGLPSGTTVFRGSTTGGDDDWFWMHVPAGKSLCVAGAITNNNTSCTTGVTMYSVQSGWIAGGNGNQLFQSRSAITSGDFVCRAPSSENDYVMVDVEGPGWAGCQLTYDILLQIR